jgi:threonine dehydratase
VSLRPTLRLPTLADIEAARDRLADLAIRTPLIRLPQHSESGVAARSSEGAPPSHESRITSHEIFLKLENLQPIGSFKIRGAGNAMRRLTADALHDGVCTASAGNMAQGVAWCAREMGVSCRVIVPDTAPAAKIDAVEALGAEVIPVPFAAWWNVMETHDTRGVPGVFIHPVENNDVMAGNGTIALEIAEDLPHIDAVVVPFGGGGLISGIGSGIRALKPSCQVIAAEVETAAPLRASLDAGEARAITRTPSFIDGIGGASVLPAMWPLVRQVVEGSVVVTLDDVAEAIRMLVRHARIVAEGAGAAALAAALTGRAGARRIVCVVSGGNIDPAVLASILQGSLP